MKAEGTTMGSEEKLTRAQLAEQASTLGIKLSAKASTADIEAAIEAYSRGFAAGCAKSYASGYEDGNQHAIAPGSQPTSWPEAEKALGRTAARQKYPGLYDEFCQHQREERLRGRRV
jgi:hypothetical protein